MMPFWDKIWSHVRVKIGPICVSWQICAESPAATSPRYCFSLIFRHLRHSKTIEKTKVFLIVLLYQRKTCSRIKSLQHETKMDPNFDQQYFKKAIVKGVKSALAFCMLFWPKLTPKIGSNWLQIWHHKWSAKRVMKRDPSCADRGLSEQGWGGGGAQLGP